MNELLVSFNLHMLLGVIGFKLVECWQYMVDDDVSRDGSDFVDCFIESISEINSMEMSD